MPPSEQIREILNVDEAAEFLGFSAYTIREKTKDGEIPGRKVGKEWRFSRRQLLEWVEGAYGAGPELGNEKVTPIPTKPARRKGRESKPPVTRLV